MKVSVNLLVLIAFIMVMVIDPAFGRKGLSCYKCDQGSGSRSGTGPSSFLRTSDDKSGAHKRYPCKDFSTKDRNYKTDCGNDRVDYICYTWKANSELIGRGCAPTESFPGRIGECKDIPGKGIVCSCDTDYCNKATSLWGPCREMIVILGLLSCFMGCGNLF